MSKLIDLSGKQFERLTVLERDYQTQEQKNSRDVFWKCICSCGQVISVRGQDLRQNKIKSCGCLKKEQTRQLNFIDLQGQKFGKLFVISEANKKIDGHVCWYCQCDCGNTCIVMGKHLRSGMTKSCGCLKSAGELKLIQILLENNIRFETQKCFEGCKNVQSLKFDIYLPDFNAVIEYNGKQHYEPISFLGGELRFIQQQQVDNIKKEWCKNNGIKLVEIPYLDYSKLNIEYLNNKLKGEN